MWEELRIQVDDDVVSDLELLPREIQDAIFDAIVLYAKTGRGGQVAYAPSGSRPLDALHVDGFEIRFHIDLINADGPTMVLSEVCGSDDLPPGDD